MIRAAPAQRQHPAATRLRIAVLCRNFAANAGGAERYAVALVDQQLGRHEVHVFAQRFGVAIATRDGGAAANAGPGYVAHRIAGAGLRPRWINQLWFAAATWWATRRGYDLVHSHDNTWHGQVQTVHVRTAGVGHFHGRRGWARLNRRLQLATSPRLWTYLLLERARLRVGPRRAVVAVSRPLAEELCRAYPRLGGRVEVLPPGVEPRQAGHERGAARAGLGLPVAVPLLLFVAHDYARKGLPTVLEALAGLPQAHLVVVGRPGRDPSSGALAERLGVSGRVHFAGPATDLAPYFHAADLLVHPTREDTFGMVVLEAMACGLPVIVSASPWCGIAAELADGRDAVLLSEPRDALALRAAVAGMLANPERRARLAEAGRAVAGRLSWAACAEGHEALYRRLLPRQG